MDSLPGAAALARGLCVLARSGTCGVLSVVGERATARVGVRQGRVVAMRVSPDDGDSIGAVLRAMGAWDEAKVRAAGSPPPGVPLGRWAVRIGATTEAAVSHALRSQLRRRIQRLFALDPPELRLRSGSSDLGIEELQEPPTSAELIVSALRERVSGEPLVTVRRKLGDGLLILTPLGKELLESAVLWPDEQVMVPLLERGASVDELLSASRGSPRAQRTLYALRVLGACGPPEPRRGYAVLLRKTRQLRRGARASELLDLPAHAGGVDARRALRRLATSVHPDRFGTAAPEAIKSASHAVMTALVRAQRELP